MVIEDLKLMDGGVYLTMDNTHGCRFGATHLNLVREEKIVGGVNVSNREKDVYILGFVDHKRHIYQPYI